MLLAHPTLVGEAVKEVPTHEIEHLGLRQMLGGLYALHKEGEPPTLDLLRARLDRPEMAQAALTLQEVGKANPDPAGTLRELCSLYRKHRAAPAKQEIHNQLHAVRDHAQAIELLRRLQDQSGESRP